MARVKLTAGRIRDFRCEPGHSQSFLWDSETPGLAIRATAAGGKAFVFQGKLIGKSIRITIGDVAHWNIEGVTKDTDGRVILYGAREEAGRLQALIDQKIDPRQAKADDLAAAAAKQAATAALLLGKVRRQITVREAWQKYVLARQHKWSQRHKADHEELAHPGGRVAKRGTDRITKSGPLAPLLSLKLSDINADVIRKWLVSEADHRPTRARLAFNLFRAFINWCESEGDFRDIAEQGAVSTRIAKDNLPKKKAKKDCLQKEQLVSWFAAVLAIGNPVVSNYLQILLLTGARRTSLAAMKWEDVDFRWNSLTIRDKEESKGGEDGTRTIPLTPYVAALLSDLKRRRDMPPPQYRILHGKRIENDLSNWRPSPWVFASKTSASGRLSDPTIQHYKACSSAAIEGLTLHGLRRSFASLSEWVEIPTGIVAQIMGHKPSATAEKHYKPRSIDMLRMWHTKYEAWILDQARIKFDAAETTKGLKAIG